MPASIVVALPDTASGASADFWQRRYEQSRAGAGNGLAAVLAEVLALDVTPPASGPLRALARGRVTHAVAVDPVCLLAGMDTVTMGPPPAGVAPDAARAIAATATETAAAHGFELALDDDLTGFAVAAEVLEAFAESPAALAGSGLREAFPRGPDGPRLRRLMTELQMALHAMPAPGGPVPVNALWFWGAGDAPAAAAPVALPPLHGRLAEAWGLWCWLGADGQIHRAGGGGFARGGVRIVGADDADSAAAWLERNAHSAHIVFADGRVAEPLRRRWWRWRR